MDQHNTIDTLAEFHMHNHPDKVYALLAHIIAILDIPTANDTQDDTYRNISNLLGDLESIKIMQLFCHIYHIDYLELMHECQTITLKRISPRLLLHIMFLPTPYVANKLEIDVYFAQELLTHLRNAFTIDQPLLWLRRLLDQTNKERLHDNEAKHDLLMGRSIAEQPVDTAEERKIKLRKFHLTLKPPDR
jgi:hypothetical protein